MDNWKDDFDIAADKLQKVVEDTIGIEVFWITNRLAMSLKRLKHDIETQLAIQAEDKP